MTSVVCHPKLNKVPVCFVSPSFASASRFSVPIARHSRSWAIQLLSRPSPEEFHKTTTKWKENAGCTANDGGYFEKDIVDRDDDDDDK